MVFWAAVLSHDKSWKDQEHLFSSYFGFLNLHWVQGLQGHNSIASVHSPDECLTVLHFKRLSLDLKASSTQP